MHPALAAFDLAPDVAPLARLLRGRRVAIVAGAGCSTESGIPDYRGPTAKPNRNPITYRQFTRSAETRRRYWARSFVGWPSMRAARPNRTHHALVDLAAAVDVSGVVTQNVDRLHHAAGQRGVVELHGALAEVVCLCCGDRTPRDELQRRLALRNPTWAGRADTIAPDGDADLRDSDVASFEPVGCVRCGGVLKPRVVFFGENVPATTTAEAWRAVDDADALLVVGSSLTVWSGYRFVRKAAQRGQPVGIVNLGPTRGDGEATIKLEGRLGVTLPALVEALRR